MTTVNLDEHIARQKGQRKRYEGANIEFKMETVPDPVATTAANGVPKFKEIEILIVQYPGMDVTPVRVEPHHRIEYKEHYEAFKQNLEPPTEGTPLTMWSMMPRPVVEEFRNFGVKTVEQVAGLPDEVKRKMGPLQKWCKVAKEWLKAANSDQNRVVTLESQVETLMRANKKQAEQITLLHQRIEATEGTRLSEPN